MLHYELKGMTNMMKCSLSLIVLFSSVLFCSCGSHAKPAPKPVVTKKPPVVNKSSTAVLAKKVLHHPKINLYRKQVSGVVDKASSYHNIASTAAGYSARRSVYGTAPGGYTKLNKRMLETMLYLANVKGYRFNVTSIAGGSHSKTSRHYVGTAFDVSMINGKRVNSSNPYYRTFMSICRARGATEVLGPGDRGHSSHVHIAWPR